MESGVLEEHHNFGVYRLPNLKNYPFEGTGRTFDKYVKVSRIQNSYLKKSRDRLHNDYSVLSPNIPDPSFSYWRDGAFPGFAFLKWEENLVRPFVKPILDLARKRYCSRCKEPSLPWKSWGKAVVQPADGQTSGVHRLPPEIWGKIFGGLTVFEVWVLKETCKGLYRLHHESLRCMRELTLECEEDKSAEGN